MWLLRRLCKKRRKWVICVIAVTYVIIIMNDEQELDLLTHYHVSLDNSLCHIGACKKLPKIDKDGSRANYSAHLVDNLVKRFQLKFISTNSVLALNTDEPYRLYLKRLNLLKKKGIMLVKETNKTAETAAERFHQGINQLYLYDPNDDAIIQDLLKDLSTLPIVAAEYHGEGSQLKLKLTYSDGSQGFFKPMRQSRDFETPLDDFVFNEMERHTAEIAGFHLDRALGFQRVLPTVSRKLNMTRDLVTFLNSSAVEFIYDSPAGNMCFVAKCVQFCGKLYPICGQGTLLEGSITAALQGRDKFPIIIHPYQRSYLYVGKAEWEDNEIYCDQQVKKDNPFYRILEFTDLAVLDFLMGNLDRHEYEMFKVLGKSSFLPVLDNGRGFGKSKYDCMSCLAPLTQCCVIRLSTLAKLIKLYQGPDSLSQVLRASLNSDPLSPILTEPHLDALDRRLGKVIKAVSDCINDGRSWEDVVVDDIST